MCFFLYNSLFISYCKIKKIHIQYLKPYKNDTAIKIQRQEQKNNNYKQINTTFYIKKNEEQTLFFIVREISKNFTELFQLHAISKLGWFVLLQWFWGKFLNIIYLMPFIFYESIVYFNRWKDFIDHNCFIHYLILYESIMNCFPRGNSSWNIYILILLYITTHAIYPIYF